MTAEIKCLIECVFGKKIVRHVMLKEMKCLRRGEKT